MDFESYIKLNSKEECLSFIALSFLDFLKDLKYPGALKKFEKEELLRSAIILFSRVRRKNADWLNLDNLWTLRNCIRVNCHHGVGIDNLLYGDNFSGDLSTLVPLTKARFEKIQKVVKKYENSL